MKRSIRTWLVASFAVVLIVSVAATAVWTYFDARDSLLEEDKKLVLDCAALTTQLLHQTGFDLLQMTRENDLVTYQEAREYLRRLCQVFGLDYLYVFSLDMVNGIRTYRYCVASDDALDEKVQVERPPGIMLELPVLKEELQALSGEAEFTYFQTNNEYGDELTMLVPYRNRIGNTSALIGADIAFDVTMHNIFIRTVRQALPLVLALILALIVLLVLVNRKISQPVRQISSRMNSFISDRGKSLPPLTIRSQDEIGEIARSFEKMRGDIDDYLSRIGSLTRQQAETDVQMEIARRIQLGLVPERTTLSEAGWNLSTVSRPTKEVGGDFYDCFAGKDGVCFMVGDVSGKGVSAALFMSTAKTLLHEKLAAGVGPARALNEANDVLCAMNPEGLFATVFAGVYEPQTGLIRFANAGHTRPVLFGKEASFLAPDPGIALGLFEDAGIPEATLTLSPGEGILLYTDGVTEARSAAEGFFGEERLLACASGLTPESKSADVLGTVLQSLEAFTRDNDQFDDIALLALCRENTSPTEEKTLPVELSSFESIKKDVFSLLGETPEARQILLACDEILTNIVSYSGADALRFRAEKTVDGFTVSFSDNGKPFDPTVTPSGSDSFESMSEGGMGLGLVHQLASSMHYEREDDENRLTLGFDGSV